MRVQLPSRLLTAFWPLSIPSPGAATALAPAAPSSACLPASLCSSAFIFSASFPEPSSRRCAPTLQPTARKRERGGKKKERKWESGKSHSLLQHPCLPTHNAVLRFVQLPRSLLVCMYTSTPPAALHLPLIAQQKAAGCRYFGCGNLARRYSAATSLLPRLLQRQVRNTARQTDREMPVNAASPPNSRLGGAPWLGGISARHLLLP